MYHVRIPLQGGWGLVEQTSRVLRGGSWNNDNPDNFRCANRNNNGFRLASTIPCQSPVLYGGEERAGRVQTRSRPQGQISKWRGAAGSLRGRTSPHAFFITPPLYSGEVGRGGCAEEAHAKAQRNSPQGSFFVDLRLGVSIRYPRIVHVCQQHPD